MLSALGMGTMAQTAQQVLDKTAAVIGNKKGATANFKMSSPKYGSASGTITIKGNKFNARTPEAIVWYNGKTQWTYMKKTNEVNVSNPTQAKQMSMNPYTFIHIYKTGYKSSLKTVGSNYQVHLVANNQKRSVAEMYITINKNTLMCVSRKVISVNFGMSELSVIETIYRTYKKIFTIVNIFLGGISFFAAYIYYGCAEYSIIFAV